MKMRDLMYFGVFITLIVTVFFTAFTGLLTENSNTLSAEFKNSSFYSDFGMKYSNDLSNNSKEGQYYTSIEGSVATGNSNLGIGDSSNSSITQGSSEWDLIFNGFNVVKNMANLPTMLVDFLSSSTSSFGNDLGGGVSGILSFLVSTASLALFIFFIFELIKALTGRDL